MSQKVPAAVLTQVCADWQAAFPGLARFRGGTKLLKRVGGIVLGMELLKIYDTEYRPTLVVINLMDPFDHPLCPAVEQTFLDARGMDLRLWYKHHVRDVTQAVAQVRAQALLDPARVPTLDEVIRATLEHAQRLKENPAFAYEAVILLSRLCADPARGDAYRAAAVRGARAMRWFHAIRGDGEKWLAARLEAMPEQMLAAVDGNLRRYRMESVPVAGDLVLD